MEENDVDPAIEKALKSFLCFLYVGNEFPIYVAKPWNNDDHYLGGRRLRSLEILASNKKTELTPIDKIKLAMDSSLIQRPETLMFALAMCARQEKSEKLRAAAYYFLAEHCKDWKYFILFIKYASELCKAEGRSEKSKEDTNDENDEDNKENANDEEETKNEEAGNDEKETKNKEAGNDEKVAKNKEAENDENNKEAENDENNKEAENDENNKEGAKNKKGEGPIGWGRGWKNAVNKWYLNHSAWDLAILVGKHRGGHGWKHKDILKLSHIHTQGLDVEKKVVIKYVLNGLDATSKEYESVPEAKKMLDYFRQVDNIRKWQDPVLVADNIPSGSFTMDHVHPTTLKSKQVWLALLPHMDVRTILKNLQKMNRLRLFTKMSPATQIVARSLTDEANIRWNKVLPAEILEVLNLYETPPDMHGTTRMSTDPEQQKREDKHMLMEMLKKLGTRMGRSIEPPKTTKRSKAGKSKCTAAKPKQSGTQDNKSDIEKKHWKPPPIRAPDMRIRDALRTALSVAQTVDITGNSKKSYLFMVRLPGMKRRNKCAEAALSIALPLFHRDDPAEDLVTILAHEQRLGIGSVAEITKNTGYDDALRLLIELKKKLRVLRCDYNMPRGPWGRCAEKYLRYDVVVNVTTEAPSKKIFKAMCLWHECLKTRIINVIVTSRHVEFQADDSYNILTINGFDQHVPWIIEAYVRGLF